MTTEQEWGKDATADGSSGGKKRRSDPHGGGGEHEQGAEDGGTPKKTGSGARGVVAVEADEGSVGVDGAGTEVGSGAHPEKAPRLSTQVGLLGVVRVALIRF